jgi:hypothetical protein
LITLAGGGLTYFMAVGKKAIKVFYRDGDECKQLVSYKINNYISEYLSSLSD